MMGRYLIVLVGALAITIGLLFFMQRLVLSFTGEGDGTLYYLIQDFIPAPDRGRQLPEAPPPPQVAPTRPSLSGSTDVQPGAPAAPGAVEPGAVVITPQPPSVEDQEAVPAPEIAPPSP